ncbi:GNAT family N-acetyltransferase [Tenacibaculum agarivorans]|uniref:GNAT family N-acetyltransferase n=1 Tax=Tenacibaculum agarivorans TaxID=1908389 RepID=UPI00094BA2CE|nr:GNAT family N-acetyltransferase [Tenacibaculum agarivorans]
MIIEAKETEAMILSNIALVSKGYWGYSKELLNTWIEELTVTPEMIRNCSVFTFQVEEKIVGFYVLNPPIGKTIELEMLFLMPDCIGKGIGKQLLLHALHLAKSYECESMNLLADPNALSFYESQGFNVIDRKESSVKGRFLPIMQRLL